MPRFIGVEPLYNYEDETKVYIPRAKEPKIVVIGGGHGQSTALRGLKRFTSHITGIVTVSDDGGGSGVLREDLGILPPGDIRNCVMALSDTEPMLEELMSHRFTSGVLAGQSFGNLFLAAMNEISSSFEEAVSRMCQVLSVKGRVLPVTDENIFLEAEFENGKTTLGERNIYYDKKLNDCRIHEVRLIPKNPKALDESLRAIHEADLIVIGPGSLYTSVIPNFLVGGVTDALAATKALRVFVMNVMTQDGETEGYTGVDHIRAFCHHASPELIDVCVANNAPIDEDVLRAYREEGSEPIDLCREEIEAMGIAVRQGPLIAHSRFARHDSEKLAALLMQIYKEMKQ